jgi:hypothetical protein
MENGVDDINGTFRRMVDDLLVRLLTIDVDDRCTLAAPAGLGGDLQAGLDKVCDEGGLAAVHEEFLAAAGYALERLACGELAAARSALIAARHLAQESSVECDRPGQGKHRRDAN